MLICCILFIILNICIGEQKFTYSRIDNVLFKAKDEVGGDLILDPVKILEYLGNQSRFLVLDGPSAWFTENLLSLFETVFEKNFPGDILHINSETGNNILEDFRAVGVSLKILPSGPLEIYYIFDLIKAYRYVGAIFIFYDANPENDILQLLSKFAVRNKYTKFIVMPKCTGSHFVPGRWDLNYFDSFWIDSIAIKNVNVHYGNDVNEKRSWDKLYWKKIDVPTDTVDTRINKFVSRFNRTIRYRKGRIRLVIIPDM